MSNDKFSRGLPFVLAALIGLAACDARSAPAEPIPFKIAVIVDTTTDPVSRAQADAMVSIANLSMLELTGFQLQMVDFVEDSTGGSIDDLVQAYMAQSADPPNGILIFSVGDDDRAKIHRAYARQIPVPGGYRNEFVSPYLSDDHVFVGVLQFNYHYAACGYAGADTVQSQVSSPGECPGEDGQRCAEWSGMQVCPIAVPILKGHTPIDMTRGPIVHEFMHGFGDKGPDDHYFSPVCQTALGREPDYFDNEESERYNGFCPTVYEVFANSYRP